MAHDKQGKWRLIRKLGEGGQGAVFLAFDEESLQLSAWDIAELHKLTAAADSMKHGRSKGKQEAERETILIKNLPGVGDAIASLVDLAAKMRLGALKKLKPPEEWSRDPQHVKDRLVQEIAVLRELRHPNLPNLLDADERGPWLVTEYYARGDLRRNQFIFSNQPEEALRAIRGLASGVAALHKKKMIHRDIKSENIFLSPDGRLILGDFGLILPGEQADRFTKSGDNAGTYAWMPPWAMNVRHEFMPTFDVYALGKILWFLLSDKEALPTEYADGDLLRTIDDVRAARLVERLVRQCVVLREEDCLPTVIDFIAEIDDAIEALNAPAPATELKMIAHAISRPGPIYLVSVEASTNRAAPACMPPGVWKFGTPAPKAVVCRRQGSGHRDIWAANPQSQTTSSGGTLYRSTPARGGG